MPLKEGCDGAIQSVLKNLEKFPNKSKDTDIMFLKVLMNSPVVQSLARAHDTLESKMLSSTTADVGGIVKQVIHDIEGTSDTSNELCKLLETPHMQSILVAHDAITKQRGAQLYVNEQSESVDLKEWQTAVRMVGLSKKPNESLGLTVAVKDDTVVVSRILHGGLIHRQGLLHVGDTICEVNGESVKGQPERLRTFLEQPRPSYIFKIIPSYKDKAETPDVFMKCNFDYDPSEDDQIPTKEASIRFQQNDIVKIVDRTDRKWWQAHHVNAKGEPIGLAGLVPSLELQERRRVLKYQSSKLKKKPHCKMYKLSDYYNQYTDDFPLYEEVTLFPPFQSRILALVSQDGKVAHQVKATLLGIYPNLFKSPITHTSNKDDKESFEVTSKETMLEDIKNNKYFEYTEKDNELYGTKYISIRNIMKSCKTCLKDVSFQNLKLLMTSEFMPYVIFFQTDSETDPRYSHMISMTIPHTSVDQSCVKVYECLHVISTTHQWLPVRWLY